MEKPVFEQVPLLISYAGQSTCWHCGPSSLHVLHMTSQGLKAEPGMPETFGTEKGWEGGDKFTEKQNDRRCYFFYENIVSADRFW